jgi:hypothetical protein
MALMPNKNRGFQLFKALISAGPDFVLAGSFLIVWLFPYALGEQSVKYFLVLMQLEFIVIHSTPFLAAISLANLPLPKKLLFFIGLVLFYSLFAAGFSFTYGSAWPLISFWTLTLTKYPSLIFSPSAYRKDKSILRTWAVMTSAYLAGLLVVGMLPNLVGWSIPRFGLTDAVIKQLNLPGTDAWFKEPYGVLAFGIFYFLILGIYDLWLTLKPQPESEEVNKIDI